MTDPRGLTPYPPVNYFVGHLLSLAETALGSQLAGFYLHGSLALGDFDPLRSDVDFLAVTVGELRPDMLSTLTNMHTKLRAGGIIFADRLEGAYIPAEDLRRHNPARSRFPALRVDGSFGVDDHGSDWVIQRHIIREHGITLSGPPPRDLIDPVSADDLKLAVIGILREWWSLPLPCPERFDAVEYRVYAVLTMCRAIYTLNRGETGSKPQSARWAIARLGDPWACLIRRVMEWQPGDESINRKETLDFIEFTLGYTGAR
jgi:hypothetical protein